MDAKTLPGVSQMYDVFVRFSMSGKVETLHALLTCYSSRVSRIRKYGRASFQLNLWGACLLTLLLFCSLPQTLLGAVNPSPAAMISPAPGSILPGWSANFSWTAGSGVTSYALYLGTTGAGSHDLYYPAASTATSASVSGLPTTGVTIYATLFSLINGAWQSIPYTYAASATSAMATLTSPAPGSTLAGSSATFSWTVGTGVNAYALHLGTGPLTNDVYDSGVTSAKSITVTGLPMTGATIYATVYSEIDGVWFPASYTYTEAKQSATLSALSCSSVALVGAAADACKVTLTMAAPAGGLTVSLSSDSWAVVVPSAITVPANATSASFTAIVAAVATAKAVTVTAKAGSISKSISLTLEADECGLKINETSIAFGDVAVGATSTQDIVLTSIGLLPVTISSATLTGSGFTLPGTTFPVTLNPGQAMTVNIEFTPKAAGAVTGQLSIVSNSSAGATTVIQLEGTGTLYEVKLAWEAPASSSVPVAGYDVLRAQSGSSSYALLNSTPQTATTYVDSTVKAGITYDYVIESVSSSGAASPPSSAIAVTIP
jgi:hypothetical protein